MSSRLRRPQRRSRNSVWKSDPESMSEKELKQLIAKWDKEMKHAALELQFERAAELRDKILEIKKLL